MHLLEHRIGRMRFSEALFELSPENLAMIFAKLSLIVLRAEFIYGPNAFEYLAYSPCFRPVPRGEISPFYEINVTSQFEDDHLVDFQVEALERSESFTRILPSSLDTFLERLRSSGKTPT